MRIRGFDYKGAAQQLNYLTTGFKISNEYSRKMALKFFETDSYSAKSLIIYQWRVHVWRKQFCEINVFTQDSESAFKRFSLAIKGFGIQLNKPFKGIINQTL